MRVPSNADVSHGDLSLIRTLIVVPCLDEAKTIEPLLRKLDQQRSSASDMIVVADGGSKDGTQEIVLRVAQELPNVALMHNAKRIQSAAINLAVQRFGAEFEYLIRIDAHGDYPDDYCRTLLQEAVSLEADSIVVGMETVGFGLFQRATAAAQNSKLGNGGSKHRAGSVGHWIDHGHHALMRTEAFRAVGGYDESFSHNEDAELDFRLRAAGYRIWMTDRTRMVYYPRSTVKGLFRQYLGYGRGRARNLLKHRNRPKIRQAILLSVAPLVLIALLSVFWWWMALPALAWAALCLGYGAWISLKGEGGPLVGVSAMTMHFAWSAGFWLQLIAPKRQKTALA